MAVSESVFVLFIFVVIFVSLTLAIQVAMILWRKCHPRSFEIAIFCALCWIPPIFAFMTSFWWFLVFWCIFFAISTLTLLKAHQRPMLPSTPGLIFNWFYLVHNCSFLICIIGSMTFLIGFSIGVSQMINFGTLCTLYGIYFGLVGNDFARHINDNLFFKPEWHHLDRHMPYFHTDRHCYLCGHFVSNESKCRISCNHTYHEHCIRGWHMVCKKSSCPMCREKVDYRFDRNPWETPDVILKAYHKFIRWLVVYLPVLLLAFGFVYVILQRV